MRDPLPPCSPKGDRPTPRVPPLCASQSCPRLPFTTRTRSARHRKDDGVEMPRSAVPAPSARPSLVRLMKRLDRISKFTAGNRIDITGATGNAAATMCGGANNRTTTQAQHCFLSDAAATMDRQRRTRRRALATTIPRRARCAHIPANANRPAEQSRATAAVPPSASRRCRRRCVR